MTPTSGAPPSSIRALDPLVEVEKLRDHLASHDKPIAFLFGAGTSAGVLGTDGKPLVPAVAELTGRCQTAVEALGGAFGNAWKQIVAGLPADRRTIEDILSAVRSMRTVVTGKDKLAGLGADELSALESELQQTISREARPPDNRFPDELPHAALGRWLRRIERSLPVEIFTTNYDTLIERALEAEWVPVFDGFVGAHRPFFSATSLAREAMAPGRRWTRVWKIHGSVTWTSSGGPTEARILRGPETASGELILPSLLKYDESRKQPYVAMMDRLGRVLTEREDAVLVTCGYSFGDQHINEVILESLEANPRLHVFALCHSDPPLGSELVRAAKRHGNILVLARRRAIVGSREGEWRLSDPALGATRLDGLFRPEGAGAGGNKPATTGGSGATGAAGTGTGQLALGDVNVLCLLLDRIAGADA
jgi:SIR2-like domain